MPAYPPQKPRLRKHATAKALTIALAFLCVACAKEQVVVDPVAFSKVPARLKQLPPKPKCDLRHDVEDYSTEEIKAVLACREAEIVALRNRHASLRRAVEKREAAVDAALEAAK